jgi:hypothetical protein
MISRHMPGTATGSRRRAVFEDSEYVAHGAVGEVERLNTRRMSLAHPCLQRRPGVSYRRDQVQDGQRHQHGRKNEAPFARIGCHGDTILLSLIRGSSGRQTSVQRARDTRPDPFGLWTDPQTVWHRYDKPAYL